MKRFSAEDRERQLRHLNKLARKRSIRHLSLVRNKTKRKKNRQSARQAICITAPPVFSIETNEHRTPLIEFLKLLRWHYKNSEGRTLVIDFSHTNRFVADGTLLFYAELTRLIEYGQGKIRLRCTKPANERASQVLEQIGVYGLCAHPSHGKPTLGDVVHWQVARGHTVDNNICAPAIEAFEGRLASPLVDGIFRGLGEAMTNAKQHAYLSVRPDELNFAQPRQDWWMFSQAKDGYLSVVFCDLGVGIPVTLPVKKPGLFARLIGRETSDSACIKEAVEDSRTSTKLPGRGHGLGNIINVCSTLPHSIVAVWSNRGCYIMRDGKTITYDFKESILGTLIYWRVPLDGAQDGA